MTPVQYISMMPITVHELSAEEAKRNLNDLLFLLRSGVDKDAVLEEYRSVVSTPWVEPSNELVPSPWCND